MKKGGTILVLLQVGTEPSEVVLREHMKRVHIVLKMTKEEVDTVTQVNDPITFDTSLVITPGHKTVIEVSR